MAQVLVVDDEVGIREFMLDALESEGHLVKEAPDGEAAWHLMGKHRFQVVISDLKMPRLDGLGLLRRIKEQQPEVEVILLTAHGTIQNAVEAMKLGAFDYLAKPIASPAELRLMVGRAVERYRLKAASEILEQGGPSLTFGAPSMIPVVNALKRVALTPTSVLLTGESGVGKEVAARAIHRGSPRASGPFVAINCATLSDTLLESELFGHEKGAFTDAKERRRGKLELADGGTFFLDEVGELKPDLQARLLRVIQERTFERLGGSQVIEVDVRIVAATNRDLPALMSQGRFREDLYHRLAVFPIQLPPLRERREDILPLADYLLAELCRKSARPKFTLDPSAREVLLHHAWPGNVRELANVLERALILAEGDHLGAGDLWLTPAGPQAQKVTSSSGPPTGSKAPTLAEAERDAIQAALSLHDGNRRKAAEHLGIGLRTLYDKLTLYNLS